MRTERAFAVVACAWAGAGLGCLGSSSAPATIDAGARPMTQAVQVQAAHNDESFFLHARWSSSSLAPALAVALSSRAPATEVRDFASAGCFLACHDFCTGMPNWIPEDGDRPMALFPGFGGPADVWAWRAQPGDPVGQAVDSSLGTGGLGPKPDGGVGLAATGSVADLTWDVLYTRPLAAGGEDIPLSPGDLYHLGLALHPDGSEGRYHYVSLPLALGLDVPSGGLDAVTLPGVALPDFSDTASFPPLSVDLFLPGITSFEFLVGAVVDRNGQLRNNDYRHGGARAVATGALGCGECHRVESDSVVPPVQNAGALERLVLRRGGVFSPAQVEVSP